MAHRAPHHQIMAFWPTGDLQQSNRLGRGSQSFRPHEVPCAFSLAWHLALLLVVAFSQIVALAQITRRFVSIMAIDRYQFPLGRGLLIGSIVFVVGLRTLSEA